MNVVHINSDYGNTIYKNLSDALFNLNVDQRVFKFVRPNNMPNVKYDDFVDVRLNYKNLDRYIFHIKHYKVLKDFLRFYKKVSIDLIHAHTLFSNGYVAYKVYKFRNIPYVVTVRGTDISVFFKYMRHLRKLGIDILLNSQKIIFLSYAHRNIVINTYVPLKYRNQIMEKSIIVPNGIDDYYFKNVGKPKTINLKDEIVLLTTAWINNNKNQINVCEAISNLNKEGFKIKYRVVGGVEVPDTYDELVAKLKSFDFVELIPRKKREDLLEEYRNSDLFILVSHKETFGLSYIEALLQCRPIIYSKGQGIDGYFKDGSVGFAAESMSTHDISNKIKEALYNYDLLSKNTIDIADKFKWENIALKTRDIYQASIK